MTPAVLSQPRYAVLADMGRRIMDVILHIGAQRTATTTFQAYLRANAPGLAAQGVGFWGPLRTRHGGLLSGILPDQTDDRGNPVIPEAQRLDRARRRICAQVETVARRGFSHLIISDENILGTVRQNLRALALYPQAGERLGRFATAFDGAVGRVVLSLRALDDYWASAWAFAVGRGHRLPSPGELDRLVVSRRSWQQVIKDVAAAFPGADLQVHAHEIHASRPDQRLRQMVDGAITAPMKDARHWLHRAPDLPQLRARLAARGGDPETLPAGGGRWQLFNSDQATRLRQTHEDDLLWLAAGAGGLATLIEEDQPDQAGDNLPGGATTRGQEDDQQDRRLARTG
ncbi:hypothetical protein [Marimonas arenosa]|uniref:Uncharacterized protein n=1 Tax=Marimonas arenosa TaxID=1795305 RepID=A0AAE4B3G0_9RHOB|nr:hypothetical protein [Marimonas arenosa]MDQ2088324.1 hypothetical protein [Marimonas arenosa]